MPVLGLSGLQPCTPSNKSCVSWPSRAGRLLCRSLTEEELTHVLTHCQP